MKSLSATLFTVALSIQAAHLIPTAYAIPLDPSPLDLQIDRSCLGNTMHSETTALASFQSHFAIAQNRLLKSLNTYPEITPFVRRVLREFNRTNLVCSFENTTEAATHYQMGHRIQFQIEVASTLTSRPNPPSPIESESAYKTIIHEFLHAGRADNNHIEDHNSVQSRIPREQIRYLSTHPRSIYRGWITPHHNQQGYQFCNQDAIHDRVVALTGIIMGIVPIPLSGSNAIHVYDAAQPMSVYLKARIDACGIESCSKIFSEHDRSLRLRRGIHLDEGAALSLCTKIHAHGKCILEKGVKVGLNPESAVELCNEHVQQLAENASGLSAPTPARN